MAYFHVPLLFLKVFKSIYSFDYLNYICCKSVNYILLWEEEKDFNRRKKKIKEQQELEKKSGVKKRGRKPKIKCLK